MLIGTGSLAGVYLYLKPGLPDAELLKTVQLQTPLQVFTSDGQLLAQFGEKRREPTTINEVPLKLVRAFLAAEDDNFRNHLGIDPLGLLRAAWQLISSGQIQSGGSTITMQVAKNYFLSHERTFARKFNEILLALEIEKTLTKDEILELYFNVIFLGHRAYGVNAAAQIYYGKTTNDLTLAEAAMIAGLPKAPSKYNPITNPTRAKERRNWILGRMLKLGFIEKSDLNQAINQPITAVLHGVQLDLAAPYVAEEARRAALEIFNDRAYTDGLRVYTTINGKQQKAAQNAVIKGLLEYDKRHGWRGIKTKLSGDNLNDWKSQLANHKNIGALKAAVVVAATENQISAITRDKEMIRIEPAGFNWARVHQSVDSIGSTVNDARRLVQPGDLIRVLYDQDLWWLAQQPEVEAGFVALDPENGAIRAMVGGFNYFESKFNRATQGGRLVGSGIKPLIYTAALESGMTPATLINDSPVVFDQTEGATDWRPQNSSGTFLGPTRLRKALYRSRNLVSVRLVRELGIDSVIDIAGRFGLDTAKLPRDLSISLGTASLTPLEMAETYAVFANGGFKVKHHLIDRIESANGTILYQTRAVSVCRENCEKRLVSIDAAFDNRLQPTQSEFFDLELTERMAPRVLSPRIHFLIDDMLKDVIQVGTAKKASKLGRKDIAGKTGTTNDQVDAWFSGYHPTLVASVWVGFDQPKTLGRSEYGGRAALPIWIEFMRTALKNIPERNPTLPAGLIATRIDPDTGAKALNSESASIREFFLIENPPKEPAPNALVPADSGSGISSPQQLF
ncbi:penicillin-binding protein 1A [Litorivicinus sp.]|nr:penicillin-binding protein 1A [Litorivicinus sp.]